MGRVTFTCMVVTGCAYLIVGEYDDDMVNVMQQCF